MDEQTIRFRYESASAKLEHIEPNLYSLRNVWANKKRQGHGTGVLNMIVRFADKNNITIITAVQHYGRSGPDDKQLVDLYSRFGFERNTNFPKSVYHLIRKPNSQKLHGL